MQKIEDESGRRMNDKGVIFPEKQPHESPLNIYQTLRPLESANQVD